MRSPEGALHAEASDDALPVVMVPGLMCSPRLYAGQFPALWGLGPLVIAAPTRHASMGEAAAEILAIAPSRFALVGLSMGGYLAFEIMRRSPGRVAKLALLDTSARADTPEQAARRRTEIALAREGRLHQVVDERLPLLLGRSNHGDDALRQVVRLMAEDTGADAFVRQQTAIAGRPDSRPGLAAITCPTLVLVGEEDVLTPPERAMEIAGGIPGAELICVPGAGHLSPLERPAEVSVALRAWLSG